EASALPHGDKVYPYQQFLLPVPEYSFSISPRFMLCRGLPRLVVLLGLLKLAEGIHQSLFRFRLLLHPFSYFACFCFCKVFTTVSSSIRYLLDYAPSLRFAYFHLIRRCMDRRDLSLANPFPYHLDQIDELCHLD